MITNTHSVGVVRDAVIAWRVKNAPPDDDGYWWSLPVVAETWDGELNDINGFHVKPEHVFHALDSAKGGPVEEGSVGGGTGNDLQRVQRRNRDLLARARFKIRQLHGRGAGAV
jgi:D-aminopeptidase